MFVAASTAGIAFIAFVVVVFLVLIAMGKKPGFGRGGGAQD